MLPGVQVALQPAQYASFAKQLWPGSLQQCVARQSLPASEHSCGAGAGVDAAASAAKRRHSKPLAEVLAPMAVVQTSQRPLALRYSTPVHEAVLVQRALQPSREATPVYSS
mmetsp:Transcript_30385/g.93336  ORF Transcript_30385/g.93336 Transcript_30385/m.93336 type:complete len:111 (-) Transcript_30385:119-451(-)